VFSGQDESFSQVSLQRFCPKLKDIGFGVAATPAGAFGHWLLVAFGKQPPNCRPFLS